MRAAYAVIIKWLQAYASALQFLTRLPVPVRTTGSEDEFCKSVVFFPAAGLLIGVIVALEGWLLDGVFPPVVNAILVLGLWILLSGGLHLDGLMDTADGLLSHRSRERMLEIMKDSRVGAMGVIVCVLYLMLKTALLSALLGDGRPDMFIVLLTIPAWSRAFMVTAISGWPYVREGHGLGLLYRSVRGQHAFSASVVSVLLTAISIGFVGSWSWTQVILCIPIMAGLTYLIGCLLAAVVARKLGGLTGDVYGALNEIIELGLLLALVGYFHQAG